MGAKGSKGLEAPDGVTRRNSKKGGGKGSLVLDTYLMSRHEAEEILRDSPQKSGTFLMYEDADTRRTFLAFKSSRDAVSHHAIAYHRDLYYLDGYPFPYLESIVFYYRKHKLDATRLTEQAFIEPYLMASRRIGRSPRPCRKSVASAEQSPEIPRSSSFIAKYGVYRSRSAAGTAVRVVDKGPRESGQVI